MKLNNTILLILGLTVLGTACRIEEHITEAGLNSDIDLNKLVRVHLSSEKKQSNPNESTTRAIWIDENGNDDLIFKWEETLIDSVDAKSLSLMLSDGSKALNSWENPEITSDSTSLSYTWLAVSPHEDNCNYADFTSTRYFIQGDLMQAKFCLAVGGQTEIDSFDEEEHHVCHMNMPSVFTQKQSHDPSFLREFMYMYASAEYEPNGGTSLEFKHVPATFRFIINNTGSKATSLQEISLSISNNSTIDGRDIASRNSIVTFDWTTGNVNLSYGEESYESIITIIEGEDSSLDVGENYTAYAMALPLSENNALKDKLMNIKIKRDDSEYLAYQFDGEKLAKANGEDIYNWVGGKSYTITLNLGDDDAFRCSITEENDIEFLSDTQGTYTLRYIDNVGWPLSNFEDICTLTVSEYDYTYYKGFINVNTAPHNAKSIGIYNTKNNLVDTISISGFKHSDTEPLYSVGLLSDIHCEYDGVTESISDLRKALIFFRQQKVDMICTCGDITQNGIKSELSLYQKLVKTYSPTIPVYTTTGNHDCGNEGKPINEDRWIEYTGTPITYEITMPLPNGKNDHFLFLGMYRWDIFAGYKDTDISWLKEKLDAYKNERCFIITHYFFPSRAGNFMNIYPERNQLHNPQLNQLLKLCDNNINSIWFSGHSHWKWELQSHEEWTNIHRNYNNYNEPASGWCVHIPSCAHPMTSDGISSRIGEPEDSEGAIMYVYEDHVDIQGVDLKKTKFLPIATYSLSTGI